jgi:hypothetical protein
MPTRHELLKNPRSHAHNSLFAHQLRQENIEVSPSQRGDGVRRSQRLWAAMPNFWANSPVSAECKLHKTKSLVRRTMRTFPATTASVDTHTHTHTHKSYCLKFAQLFMIIDNTICPFVRPGLRPLLVLAKIGLSQLATSSRGLAGFGNAGSTCHVTPERGSETLTCRKEMRALGKINDLANRNCCTN